MLTLAFPGNRFNGELLPELDRLKGEGIVRVIDMLIVRKDSQGHALVATASDLDFEEATALGSYFGALAGFASGGAEGFDRGAIAGAAELADGHVFDEDAIFRVTQALDRDTSAVMILLQHTCARSLLDAVARASRWARGLLDEVARANGVELMNEWIGHESVLTMAPRPKSDQAAEL